MLLLWAMSVGMDSYFELRQDGVLSYAKHQGAPPLGSPLQLAGCSVIIHADGIVEGAPDGAFIFELIVRSGRRLLLQVRAAVHVQLCVWLRPAPAGWLTYFRAAARPCSRVPRFTPLRHRKRRRGAC